MSAKTVFFVVDSPGLALNWRSNGNVALEVPRSNIKAY